MANPIQQAAVRRKIGYFVAIIALFTFTLAWRGKLNDLFSQQTAAGRWVTANSILGQAEALELRELNQGDAEITGSLARLSLVGVRGPVITGLWWAANEKQKRNEWQELELLVKMVIRLQPNFITPWIFQGWNIAYNVSVENDKLGDMFYFIARGIDLLADGDRQNTKTVKLDGGREKKIGSPDIRHTIGFFYQNKFGVSDKVQTLRSLMQVAVIPPSDRQAAFLDANSNPDPDRFRAWCVRHPQLVRRLKTKLSLNSPVDVLQFLKDNDKIPSLYRSPTSSELAEANARYPVLPAKFEEGPTEYNPGSEFDDRFDAFHASRAWFTYANTVVPPAKKDETGESLPWATPRPGDPEYDPFTQRIPRQPTLIIFKIAPARAQSYVAEKYAKEGWFDPDSGWSPLDGGALGNWLGSSPDVPLRAGSDSRVEYDRAWQLWDLAGREFGLVLDPERLNRLTERSNRVPFPKGGLPPELSPEELEVARIRPEDMVARKALTYYEQNRHMTNFAFFLDSSLAEKDPLTVRARRLLYEADQARQTDKTVLATRLYPEALARWREVLGKYPRFHRTLGDTVEEATYEYELNLINLLKGDVGVQARAEAAAGVLAALAPLGATAKPVMDDLQQVVAEEEAAVRIVTEQFDLVYPSLPPGTVEQKALQKVAAVADAAAAAVGAVALTPAGRAPVTRSLIDTEFAWMKDSGKEPPEGDILVTLRRANPEDFWVRANIKELVRNRLGLRRVQQATTESDPPPGTPTAVIDDQKAKEVR